MPAEKTKIIYLITKGNFGGAQRYVFDLATSLPDDKFDSLVVFGEGGELKKRLREKSVKTIELSELTRDVNWKNDWLIGWKLFRLFREQKPKIIHLNSSKIGLLGALAGRLAKVPKIIFTAHGWAWNEERTEWQKIVLKFLQWLTVCLSHQTIAVSEKTKNQMAKLPLIQNKFAVIHNGLSHIDFLPREEARLKLAEKIWQSNQSIQTQLDTELLNQAIIVGSIAELHKNKGLDYLIQTISEMDKRLADISIWLIGDGEEKDNLKKQIKKLGLKNQVFLLGKVDKTEQYLKAFDIFILPSRTEALPYVILEAGAAGLPVVASSVGGIPEIISDFNQGILVRPGNIKELKLAITRLLDNYTERLDFGHNLQQKVEQEFSKDKMVEKTIEVYKN